MKQFSPGILLLLLMLSAVTSVHAQQTGSFDVQQQFNRGNFLLEQREYEAALVEFQRIEEAGYRSGPLFLNTGLAWVHLGEPGLAMYYFKRAEAFSRVAPQARRGIEHIEQHLAQQQPEAPILASFQWYSRVHFDIGFQKPLLWSLILLNLAALFWTAFWFAASNKKVFRYLAYLSVALSLALALTSGYIYSEKGKWQPGMVVHSGYQLLSEPAAGAEPVMHVHTGWPLMRSMKEKHAHPDKVFVYMSNGLEGWIPVEAVRVLD